MRSAFAAVVAAFSMILGITAPGMAQDSDNPRSSYVDDYNTVVPLQLKGGERAVVRWVYLNVGGQVQAADPGAGVVRYDQNRLDWSEIPLIGRFAHDRFNQSDFAPEKAIGEAYFLNGTVWLDLSEDAADRRYPRIVFLNQDYAYIMDAAPAPSPAMDLPEGPPGRLIGGVFRGENGVLLVLVRPFVVTESLF